jgi:hypothetical protein
MCLCTCDDALVTRLDDACDVRRQEDDLNVTKAIHCHAMLINCICIGHTVCGCIVHNPCNISVHPAKHKTNEIAALFSM